MIIQILATAVVIAASALSVGGPATTAASQGAEKPYFADDFKNLDNWQAEGPYDPTVKEGKMHLKTGVPADKAGEYVWCKKELPADYRIEFDMTPTSDSGFFLMFFSVAGVKGEDILGPELFEKYMPAKSWGEYQDFDKYVSAPNRKTESRIACYHISYRRNELANCNLRKNPGLNLLKSNDLKTPLPKGKAAHVALTKAGGHIHLEVNGDVFMDYTDEKDVYSKGRFGFRQVYETEGVYENFRIFDLSKK